MKATKKETKKVVKEVKELTPDNFAKEYNALCEKYGMQIQPQMSLKIVNSESDKVEDK